NLVLSERGEGLPDRRADKLVKQKVEKECEACDQIEHVRRVAERDDRQPRQRNIWRRLDGVDAERALRQVDLVGKHLMTDDGKAEGGDRKVMAPPADGQNQQ